MNCLCLQIPGTDVTLHPGSRVRLHRFSTVQWEVRHGWYSFDDNREICGWYLVMIGSTTVKPIFKIDLQDIYSVD